MCLGQAATIVGTDRSDRLIGTEGNDVIVGLGDEDSIEGRGGNDRICGGTATDKLRGNSGNDIIHDKEHKYGTYGDRLAWGGRGDDRIDLGKWPEVVGGPGNDRLRGLYVFGGPGDDVLIGEILVGGPDDDRLRGVVGKYTTADNYRSRRPAYIDGKRHLIRAQGTDSYRNLDYIGGTSHDDVYIGGSDRDSFYGGEGNDLFRGRGGDDRALGNQGFDRLYGGPGQDRLEGGGGKDRVFGGPGEDIKLQGNEGDDRIYGGPADDALKGSFGNDLLDGGTGWDLLQGDVGNDTLFGGSGIDRVSVWDFAPGERPAGATKLNLTRGRARTPGLGLDQLNDIESAEGTSFSGDTIIGDGSTNVFYAGDYLDRPPDFVKSGGGADLIFDEGHVEVDGGAGSDWVFGSNIALSDYGSVENGIASNGSDVSGTSENNILLGSTRDDYLWGAGGEDILFGWDGNGDKCQGGPYVIDCELGDVGSPYSPTEPDMPEICEVARPAPDTRIFASLVAFCDRYWPDP
jgi:Ca2+-binding RTX toxin-like protein